MVSSSLVPRLSPEDEWGARFMRAPLFLRGKPGNEARGSIVILKLYNNYSCQVKVMLIIIVLTSRCSST